MRLPEAAIELVKQYEGLKLRAYLCPAGVPTIGYGHTKTVSRADVERGKTISEAIAEGLLAQDLSEAAEGVRRLCTTPPNENELGAMASLVFNIGIGNFRTSSVLRLHNSDNALGAAKAFLLWNKATIDGKLTVLPGLVKRRTEESMLYLKPVE